MTVCHWVCKICGVWVYSPEIPQVGGNRRDGDGIVTQEDVDKAYDEYNRRIDSHSCDTQLLEWEAFPPHADSMKGQ